MAESTKIQLKRKTSTETETTIASITLAPGEPLFNTNDNNLYIGASTTQATKDKIKFENSDAVQSKIAATEASLTGLVASSNAVLQGEIDAVKTTAASNSTLGLIKVSEVSSTTEATAEGNTPVKLDKDKVAYVEIPELLDTYVLLSEDLYTYVPIGAAQKASNEIIGGSGSTIINATNRGKLGNAGDSLKDVFNKIFGEQTDTEPTVNNNSSLTSDDDSTSYGGGEYGTPVAATNVTITFTLDNTGTANYGYRCGDNKITGLQTFYYPVTKQNGADIKITLPSDKTASANMVTAGTYVSHSSNVLYCDFDSNKQVKIKISLPEGSVTTTSQIRYDQISAFVKLGEAQKENQLTAGTAIDNFLTYLEKDATSTTALSGGDKSDTAGAYKISAGSYYNYYLASTANSLSNDLENPVTTATRYTSTSGVSIRCDSPSHIWFLLPPGTTGSKKIQYEPFANTWVDAFGGASDTTEGPIDVALRLNSSTETNTVTAMYKGYYTSAKAAAGSNSNYKIV